MMDEIIFEAVFSFLISGQQGSNSPVHGEKCITRLQSAVNPAVQIKKECFAPAQSQQFFGNGPDIFLPGNFIIGQIDAQETAGD